MNNCIKTLHIAAEFRVFFKYLERSEHILNNHCHIKFATFNLDESKFIAAYS